MQLTEILRFTVAGKPVGKARPRFTRRGFAYTPEKTVRYEAAVRAACIEAMRAQGVQKRVGVPLAIKCEFFFEPPKSWSKKRRELLVGECRPMPHKPDIDNLIKAVLDACNGIAYHDDAAVVEVNAKKRYGAEDGVVVTIEKLIFEEDENGKT